METNRGPEAPMLANNVTPFPAVAASLALWDVPRPRRAATRATAPELERLERTITRLRHRGLADVAWAGLFVSGLAALGAVATLLCT
jgi:hypothetical protein